MRFALFNGETEIGMARFAATDPPMGCVPFRLLPNDDYSVIQPLIQSATIGRLNNSQSPQTERNVTELNLTIRDEAGTILTGMGIEVSDAQAEMPDEPIEVWLIGMDREPFEYYFPGEYEHYEASFTVRFATE